MKDYIFYAKNVSNNTRNFWLFFTVWKYRPFDHWPMKIEETDSERTFTFIYGALLGTYKITLQIFCMKKSAIISMFLNSIDSSTSYISFPKDILWHTFWAINLLFGAKLETDIGNSCLVKRWVLCKKVKQ